MRKIILTLIFSCLVLASVYGNPVKKDGVVYESIEPESLEINKSDEAIIKIKFDSSESDTKEISLAFLDNTPSGENDEDSEDDEDETTSNENASVSAELLNPAEVPKSIIEPPQTTAVESISDETGTCVDTTPQESDSDENGTCLPTTLETPEEREESESFEIPTIIITKTYIDSDDDSSSSSSETVDMIINPFLQVSDIAEIIKPTIEEDEEERFASDELFYNLIDSNDLAKHADDVNMNGMNVRGEEQSFLHKRFTSFIDALMSTFVFGD